MKIRNGFVSNSSTSSFVIIGVKCRTTCKEEEYEELVEKCEENNDNLNIIFDDDGSYFGEKIIDISSEDCLEFGEQELPDKKELCEKIKKYLPNTKEEDIKIIYGTGIRGC